MGGNKLEGSVNISGSKNSVLACLAASMLTDEPVIIENIPLVDDSLTMLRTLESIGVTTLLDRDKHSIRIEVGNLASDIPTNLSTLIRGAVFLLGPLLARNRNVRFGNFGGCNIGKRPIDIHLNSMMSFGCKVKKNDNMTELIATKLKGSEFEFRFPSVGATINSFMAASLIDGQTLLRNIALEPEVLDLVEMLCKMGARIKINRKNRTAIINGVGTLEGVTHRIIPDRIEAGTYAAAVACTGGDVLLDGVVPQHLEAVLQILSKFGIETRIEGEEAIRIVSEKGSLKGVQIQTAVYPGFPTDLQPQFTALSTVARGKTRITENIFDNRFHHVPDLVSMGARISLNGNVIEILGPATLRGGSLNAKELRGGVALVIAGLCAEGYSNISGFEYISRGYENIDQKLRLLGADIELDEHN
jgi:UDP-N-acetylglucosamine 1-carboxyvinyltransferase